MASFRTQERADLDLGEGTHYQCRDYSQLNNISEDYSILLAYVSLAAQVATAHYTVGSADPAD